jgi:hypothetical protein
MHRLLQLVDPDMLRMTTMIESEIAEEAGATEEAAAFVTL